MAESDRWIKDGDDDDEWDIAPKFTAKPQSQQKFLPMKKEPEIKEKPRSYQKKPELKGKDFIFTQVTEFLKSLPKKKEKKQKVEQKFQEISMESCKRHYIIKSLWLMAMQYHQWPTKDKLAKLAQRIWEHWGTLLDDITNNRLSHKNIIAAGVPNLDLWDEKVEGKVMIKAIDSSDQARRVIEYWVRAFEEYLTQQNERKVSAPVEPEEEDLKTNYDWYKNLFKEEKGFPHKGKKTDSSKMTDEDTLTESDKSIVMNTQREVFNAPTNTNLSNDKYDQEFGHLVDEQMGNTDLAEDLTVKVEEPIQLNLIKPDDDEVIIVS